MYGRYGRVLSIVLAGGKGERLMPLTRYRAKPAVPFGAKYRIVDFALSNLVNSGMVERALDPNDRRYVTIRLTAEGDGDFREIESNMNEYYKKIYAAIPQEDRPKVLEGLRILLRAIDESECC